MRRTKSTLLQMYEKGIKYPRGWALLSVANFRRPCNSQKHFVPCGIKNCLTMRIIHYFALPVAFLAGSARAAGVYGVDVVGEASEARKYSWRYRLVTYGTAGK